MPLVPGRAGGNRRRSRGGCLSLRPLSGSPGVGLRLLSYSEALLCVPQRAACVRHLVDSVYIFGDVELLTEVHTAGFELC